MHQKIQLFLRRFFQFGNALQYGSGIFFRHYLIDVAFAVGYAVVANVGIALFAFARHDFFYFKYVLNVDEVYAAAHVSYFYKDWIHAVKVRI